MYLFIQLLEFGIAKGYFRIALLGISGHYLFSLFYCNHMQEPGNDKKHTHISFSLFGIELTFCNG